MEARQTLLSIPITMVNDTTEIPLFSGLNTVDSYSISILKITEAQWNALVPEVCKFDPEIKEILIYLHTYSQIC